MTDASLFFLKSGFSRSMRDGGEEAHWHIYFIAMVMAFVSDGCNQYSFCGSVWGVEGVAQHESLEKKPVT